MDHPEHRDIAELVADLALAEPYERALLTVRGYAAALLDTGCPKDELRRNLVRARDILEARGASEEAEDVPVDVADFLVGWCASFMRL